MQDVSSLYRSLVSNENHRYEYSLVIGDSGRLITERAEVILFAGTAILVASDSASSGYPASTLYSIKTFQRMFTDDTPEVGTVISGEIDIVMQKPTADIPRRAMLRPYIRATIRDFNEEENSTNTSEWIPQGTYFIDTKKVSHDSDGLETLTIHGYDSAIMFDVNYPSDSAHDYPLLDTEMVQLLADSINVSVDDRTWEVMTDGYMFPLPVGYSSREVLQMIASAYAGSFVMTPQNELRLIQINEMPTETNLLIDHDGYVIVFGVSPHEEVRILV